MLRTVALGFVPFCGSGWKWKLPQDCDGTWTYSDAADRVSSLTRGPRAHSLGGTWLWSQPAASPQGGPGPWAFLGTRGPCRGGRSSACGCPLPWQTPCVDT